MGMLNNVFVQWLVRRVPDWGGWIATFGMTLAGIYGLLPPDSQEAVQLALTGNWQQITLGSIIPALVVVYSQVISLRATVRPQVVQEVHGKTVTTPLREVTSGTKAQVEAVTPIPRVRTVFDVLLGR